MYTSSTIVYRCRCAFPTAWGSTIYFMFWVELMVYPHPRRQRWSSPYIGQRQKFGRKYKIRYSLGRKYIHLSRLDRNYYELSCCSVLWIDKVLSETLFLVFYIYIDNLCYISWLKTIFTVQWHLHSFIYISLYPRISIISLLKQSLTLFMYHLLLWDNISVIINKIECYSLFILL